MAAPMKRTTQGGVISLMSPEMTPRLAPRSLKNPRVLSVSWL